MTSLSDLKKYHDFEIVLLGNDGVCQDGPDPCQPLEVVSRCAANGQIWERNQTLVNRGLGTYKTHYTPVEEGPEPSEEFLEARRAENRRATENLLKDVVSRRRKEN